MIPKPIKSKGLWNKIKEVFNREYELISNLNWHNEDGECIKAMILAYHQLNAEEGNRKIKEMEQMNKKNRK